MKKKSIDNHSKNIIEAYEKNLFYLPFNKMGHFFERAYKITGDKKYNNIIAQYLFISKAKNIISAAQKIKAKKFKYSYSKKSFSNASDRKKRRLLLYKKNPEIKFYDELLIDLFFLKMFGLDKTVFKKEFTEIIKSLKKENLENIYTKEKVIKNDSSFTFNSLAILNQLGIINTSKSNSAEKLLKGCYFTKDLQLKKELPGWEFLSMIYSMTHIIIADSKYYGRYISGHQWIISYFSKNVDVLIKKTTLDILAEVGLCFKLCKKNKKYPRQFNKIIRYLVKNAKLNKLNNVDYLIKKEHTNSILMILFSSSKKLFKGPDLSRHKIFNKLMKNNEY